MDHPALSKKRLSVYAPHFGEPSKIIEGGAKHTPRVDVLAYPPQGTRSFTTLITSGMSDMRMSLSEQIPQAERSGFYRRELIWYVGDLADKCMSWMQWLGRLPFIDNTWLGHGHTVQWHEPLFPGSQLQHFLLTYSIIRTDDRIKEELEIEGDPVGLLWVNPITPQELRLKKEMRVNALLERFGRNKHPIVFDSRRPSYA